MRFSSCRMLPGQGCFLIGRERLRREALHVRAELLGVLREERLRDDEHVVAALAQRRQVDVDDVEAVVEVLAEAARADLLLEDAVGRGDDADVDLLGLAVADAEDDALLQRAQELHLQVERQLADLVEEERALVGRPGTCRGATRSAPVKAPFTWPKSSLSMRFSGMAPQLMTTNGPVARGSSGGGSRAR